MTQLGAALLDMAAFHARQAGRLDLADLAPMVRQPAEGLERPGIVESFSSALAKAEGRGHG